MAEEVTVQMHENDNHGRPPSGTNQRNCDFVKYRRGIRLISIIDFSLANVMLFLLSFGFFRVRMDAAGDKSVQAFILGMYGLYTVQILVSIILYKATHKNRPEIVSKGFKQWSTTANVLNVMLCAEVYFFILLVDGRILISMTICFLKVLFRGVAVQIVNYSIRDIASMQTFSSAILSSSLLSSSNSNSILIDSSGSGQISNVAAVDSESSRSKPPPAYEYPPKYEEAIKMYMDNEIKN